MGAENLTTSTAVELASLIRTKQISPVEVVAHFLDRIENYDGRLNAFITVASESAMTDAHRAEAAVIAGDPLGPLHGVPIGIKDLNATKGIITTYGSLVQKENVPDSDDIMVQRIKAAGAIIVGKTNTPEYGWKATTENLLTGPSHNPWDLERTSGGSSGGSAAAVAAQLVPIATGNDGGGSIRIPASFCGTYGIKPTQGRVPSVYTAQGGWRMLAQNGPISTNTRDAAQLLGIMSGPDGRNPTSIQTAPPDFAEVVENASVEGLRLGWSPGMDARPVDSEVRDATAKASQSFEELGAHVDENDPDVETLTAMDVWRTIFLTDYAISLGPVIAAGYDKMLPSKLVQWVNEAVAWPATRLAAALREREWHRRRFEEFFEEYDLLLTPTVATTAFPIERNPSVIDGQDVDPFNGFTPFCFHANLAGLPAANVPCGFDIDGMPIGLQIIGPWGGEEAVLRASAAFEAAHPWRARQPLRFSEPSP